MSLKTVGELLEHLVATMPLTGHRELGISFIEENKCWHVMVGNKYGSVMLGEVDGIYNGFGSTLEEATLDIIKEMDKPENE